MQKNIAQIRVHKRLPISATVKLDKDSYVYLTSLLIFTLQDLEMTVDSVDYTILLTRLSQGVLAKAKKKN